MRVLDGHESKWLSAHALVAGLQKWADSYGAETPFAFVKGFANRGEILAWAKSQGQVVDPDQAHDVLGYLANWPECCACGKEVDYVANLGSPCTESSDMRMCLPCLRAALDEAEAGYVRHQRREFTADEVKR